MYGVVHSSNKDNKLKDFHVVNLGCYVVLTPYFIDRSPLFGWYGPYHADNLYFQEHFLLPHFSVDWIEKDWNTRPPER